jgi:hypothetical protein
MIPIFDFLYQKWPEIPEKSPEAHQSIQAVLKVLQNENFVGEYQSLMPQVSLTDKPEMLTFAHNDT